MILVHIGNLVHEGKHFLQPWLLLLDTLDTPAAMTLCGQYSYALLFTEESFLPAIITVANNFKGIMRLFGQILNRCWPAVVTDLPNME